jgi:hypothetical protein
MSGIKTTKRTGLEDQNDGEERAENGGGLDRAGESEEMLGSNHELWDACD